MRGHRDLRLIVALTLVCAVGSLITPLGAVRVIFAVPLALILPGYALAAAAFGSRLPTWPERLPLTLGVGLACLALSSLVLNFAPGGIHGLSWTLLLVLVVLLSCRAAARRRGPARHRPPFRPKLRPSGATAILAVGALAMAAAALVLARATLENDRASGYTQLWIAPPKSTHESTRIGITSEQQQTRNYRLVVEVEGAGRPVVESFELAPSHTRMVTIPSGSAGSPVGVEAKLYLRSRPGKVYRRVSTLLQ
ncbi:MAG TPA: DUF1616 domain-containing protein [Solirubrobacterales bacterium]|nr:DUF1616 domain-containing protein [Solirubrobacterales bacterium]